MKTNKLIAAALLPLLFSCAKENIEPTIKGETFDISITVSPDDDTKAIFDDAEGVLWINPASAGLVTSKWDTVVAQKSTAATVSGDERKATFKFEGITAGTYRLFYPYAETYYPNLKFTVAANQTQDAGGKSSDIFAGMATEDITAQQGENNIVDVKYKAVGSYIQFLVYGKAGEKVRYITIVSSDSKIAGDYLVNANDFKYTIMEGGSDRVLVALGNDGYTTTESAENAKGIYASVLPGSSTNTYYVTTDNGVYSFKSSEAKTFNAGEIKTVKLNLDNANVKSETVPQELYIVGNVAYVGWNCANAKKMEKNGNVFSIDVYLSTQVKNSDNTISDAEGFKFLTQTVNWKIGYVKGTDGKLTYRSESNGVADSKFTVDKAGYYHVEANFDTKEVTCTPKAPEKLYVWGAATTAGWVSESAIKLDKSTENEFVFSVENIELKANQEFKFFSENIESTAYVNDGSGNVVFFDSPTFSKADQKFKVEKAGLYTITVDLSTGTLTTTITNEYPRVVSNNKANTYYMMPTAVENEYKATAYLGQGDDAHDFFIYQGDDAYHETDFKQITFLSDSEGYSGTVVKDKNTDLCWWISDDNMQTNRLYDITLNTATNTVTVKFAQGTNFWLIGSPFGGYNAFKKPDEYKATVDENGVAKWKVTTSTTGDFKICGEHTLSNSFYDGEWYYSTATDGIFNWSWETGNNYSTDTEVKEFDVKAFIPNGADYKWSLNEKGTFEIVFDTKKLKIKIYKKTN
ncbi:MAG: SusF/SusE family outer membrane protein [Candidatus Cryptobacteroides sp.]|nr:SusF/SusE family outer membrane protein [Candidatus Cryptobacteroides sp.]